MSGTVKYCTVLYSTVQYSTVQTVCQEPGLVIIHDLLSDKEVRAMKTNALKRYTPTALSIIIDVMLNISTISLPNLHPLPSGRGAGGQAVPEAGAGHGAHCGQHSHGVCLRATPGVCILVLQKVASELHPKVRNHGEGPY